MNAESDWKQLTLEGNQLFDSGDYSRSADRYERARVLALSGFDHWTDPGDALAAVVVSYLNLAEAQARFGDVRQAGRLLCIVHGSLQQARFHARMPAVLRDAALRHLRETFAALVRFQATYGPLPEIARWLHPGRDDGALPPPTRGEDLLGAALFTERQARPPRPILH